MSVVQAIEDGFAAWARFALRHRRSVIGVVVLATLLFASHLPQLTLLNSAEDFLEPDDPAAVTYARFLNEFGQDRVVLIGVRPPEIFSVEFLEWLRGVHAEIESLVPHVDSVTSLINARVTRSEGDLLIVEGLLDAAPRPEALDALRTQVLGNAMYRDFLVSADGRLTVIAVRPDTFSSESSSSGAFDGFEEQESDRPSSDALSNPEIAELVEALHAVLARHARSNTELFVTGSPVMGDRLNKGLVRDVARFLTLSIAVMAGLLGLLFRRISGVVLPLAVVMLALLSTLGAMGWAGASLSVVTEILPSLLIVVGICDAVHILSRVYQRVAAGDSREAAIETAMRHAGLPVLLTSVTTAGGLSSLASASIVPVTQLGFFAPLGVIFAFLYTIALLPPILSWIRLQPAQPDARPEQAARLVRRFARLGAFATRRPWLVLIPTIIVTIASAVGAGGLRVAFSTLDWFAPDEPVRVATEVIDDALGGSVVLELLLDAPEVGAFKNPEQLRRLEALGEFSETLTLDGLPVGHSVSLADLVKEIHRALSGDEPDAKALPLTRGAIAQELLLFENTGADDIADFADSDYRTARITLNVPRVDATLYADLLDRESENFQQLAGESVRVRTTGAMVLMGTTGRTIGTSIVRSYVLAFVMITPVMMLFLGSVRRGLLSMIPNVLPLLVVLGCMRLFAIPLDITTLMIGGIVLGLAVDDTIHFMHGFQREYARTRDVELAVTRTLETTGAALLVTTLVLSIGFFVFLAGEMVNIAQFGLLAGVATLVAYVADVLVAPALLSVVLGGHRPPDALSERQVPS